MLLLASSLAACGSSAPAPVDTTVVVTTVVSAPPRPTPSATFRPPPAVAVAPLAPSDPAPAGQVDAPCPYIDTTTAQNLEGNRIYRTTVGAARPISCQFWFWCCDHRATLEIAPTRFATPTDAYNAMVLTGEAGAEVDSRRSIVPGVDAVVYRTAFYAPDNGRNWACTFAAGATMVTVRTDRIDTSFNAVRIATTIAPRFTAR